MSGMASTAIEMASESHSERSSSASPRTFSAASPKHTAGTPDKFTNLSPPHLSPTVSSPRGIFLWLYNGLRFQLSPTRLMENLPIPRAEKVGQTWLDSNAYFAPLEVLVLSYIVVTTPLFFLNVYTPPGLVLLEMAVHFIVFFAIIFCRTAEIVNRRRVVVFFFEIYMPLLIFFIYKELGNFFFYYHLNRDTWDPAISNLEFSLFKSQPSQQLNKWVQFKPLGEYLYWCYSSFFVLLVVTALLLQVYASKRSAATAQGGLLFTYLACAVVWIVFPVKGPFETFGGAEPSRVGYWMPEQMNSLVKNQHSTGTAFPSSHCAMGVCFLIIAYRYFYGTRWFWLYALIVPGLIVSTVYGGFHYALDSLCGCALALLAYPIGQSLSRKLVSRFEFPDTLGGSEPVDYEMIKVI